MAHRIPFQARRHSEKLSLWLSMLVIVGLITEERDPYVDPLNLIQAELMKRGRKLSGLNGEVPNNIRALIRQSIQGLSASMRTTG